MSDAPDRVPDEVLDDLRRRLRGFRPVAGVGTGWSHGTDQDFLADLLAYWADGYDWRAAEARIRALPWTRTSNGMRGLHQPAADPDAPAVVLLHGWPDSILRFERVLPLLTDVHVVVPCLPGYPYSELPGSSRDAMADPIAGMLAELGHRRYVVSGGDIGSGLGEALARRYPEAVAALHLTDVQLTHLATLDPATLSDGERRFADEVADWRAREGGYMAEQSTKPDTLAAALGDSPAGLAAWLLEKLRSWSDCAGEVERVFPRDELLTWITVWWVTGAIGTSFAPYAFREPPAPDRVDVPTVFSRFPADLVHAPRELAERFYDVRVWDEQPAGGHFGAWEQPEGFVRGLRQAIALA
jgi:pimeloyl-ACP methyl ester carboxylesterase